MPLPKNRSRSVKRKNNRFKRPKENKAVCGLCKRMVKKQVLKNTAKPKIKFGSNLCANCSNLVNSYALRVKEGSMKLDDLSLSYQRYVSLISK